MNRLQNKVAIVTGANSGIGLRTAQLFAEEGAILVLCARRKEKLDEVAEALRAQGSQVLSIAADVSREEDCVRVVEEAVKASTEPWFKERGYGKLNEKLRRWRADRKIGPEPVEK